MRYCLVPGCVSRSGGLASDGSKMKNFDEKLELCFLLIHSALTWEVARLRCPKRGNLCMDEILTNVKGFLAGGPLEE